MIRKRKTRRTVAALLLVAGGVLMWLAPEVWWGLLLLGIGIGLELVGITLEHGGEA